METSTVLKLKVAKPKATVFSKTPCPQTMMDSIDKYNYLETKNTSMHNDFGGLSFLQLFSNISSCPYETPERENVYIHPMAKPSASSKLSEKSWLLCTETLGSETGTDIADSKVLMQSHEWDCFTANSTVQPKYYLDQTVVQPVQQSHHRCGRSSIINANIVSWSNTIENPIRNARRVQEEDSKKKMNCYRKFPPPLTTISGGNSILVRPHREAGRLVIKAVEAPSKRGYLQATRSQGRLRLSYVKDAAANIDSQVRLGENEIDGEDDNDWNNEEELEKKEEFHNQQDVEEICDQRNKDIDGNDFEIEVEIGKDKFQRNGRCNEGEHGNKGLRNWEHLCVATS